MRVGCIQLRDYRNQRKEGSHDDVTISSTEKTPVSKMTELSKAIPGKILNSTENNKDDFCPVFPFYIRHVR
jgi:hypothetical protein